MMINTEEWFESIPSDWNILTINNLLEIRTTKVSDSDYPPLSVGKMGVVPQLEQVAKTNNTQSRKLIKKGDFVINSRSDRFGACGVSKFDGSCSLIYIVTKLKDVTAVNLQYLEYLFKTNRFAEEFYRNGTGIVDDLWTTSWDNMKKIKVCLPSVETQTKIVNFLINKTSLIDNYINKLLRDINYLDEYKKSLITQAVTKGLDPNAEMKDSGVKWIGVIPKSWAISKFKYIALLHNIKNNDKALPYIGMENIESWSGELIENFAFAPEGDSLLLEPGEVIFGKLRPYLAKCFVSNNKYSCSTEFFVIKPLKVCSQYIKYLLLEQNTIRELNSTTYGAKMPRLSWEVLANMYFVFPSERQEQEEIINYLNLKNAETNKLIFQKKSLIAKLEEYKKSLIFEYVTGKKTVKEN